jgi:hypothetical protein
MNIDEKAENYINEEDQQDFDNPIKVDEVKEQPKTNKIFDILKSKTGEGTIEDYKDHPLNFNNNKYIGQILRGLTGMLGALDLAIIDISMGILGLFKDRNIVKEDIINE